MTAQEQRVKIAEACGYEIWDLSSIKSRPNLAIVGKDGKHWMPHEYAIIPDYLNDLNAMHEAEKVLTPSQKLDYINWIRRLFGREHWISLHATAVQRAEAFLRILGLWKEDAPVSEDGKGSTAA